MGEYNYSLLTSKALFCLRYEGIPDEGKVYDYVLEYMSGVPQSVLPHGFMDYLSRRDPEVYQRVNAYLVGRKLIDGLNIHIHIHK